METSIKQNIVSFFTSKYGVLIIVGIVFRILFLVLTYFQKYYNFLGGAAYGDLGLNFYDVDSVFTGEWKWNQIDLAYPPLTIYFLVLLRIIAFNNLNLFLLYAFVFEILITSLFYSVLKRFKVERSKLVLGLIFINPLYFVSFVSRLFINGYHLTDSFFCMFLLLALYCYPNENKKWFYFFLGLSMCAKWYTLPALPLLVIKYIIEKNWDEVLKIIFYLGIPIIIFLISPVFYLPNYLDLYMYWGLGSPFTLHIPIYIKIIPFAALFLLAVVYIKKIDRMSLTFLSLIIMISFILWARVYVRYFAPLIFFAHLYYYRGHPLPPEGTYNHRMKAHRQIILISTVLGATSVLISYLELTAYGVL